MAAQDGFAGQLSVSDSVFEWRRDIDFQPPGPTPDRGRLTRDGALMIEEGYHEPYIEHWHPTSDAQDPVYALRLRDDTGGCAGRIVRVGGLFMYARGRPAPLPEAANLKACIAAAGSLAEAQDMVDCEMAFGTITGTAWTIERSTLPFREGKRLDVRFSVDLSEIRTADLTPTGGKTHRYWKVVAAEGDYG